MPSYGSLRSPSIKKMEQSRMYRQKRFQISNILGDPFALATISISSLAWVISFISCIIAQINSNATNTFNKFSWWAVIYSLFLIGGTFVVVAIDAVHTYHVAMTGYLSAGLVLTSVAVNSLVYSSNGASEAAAAGFILLSMVLIIWIFYFGSTPASTPRAWLDGWALSKDASGLQQHQQHSDPMDRRRSTETSPSVVAPPSNMNMGMYTTQLNGFENPSPVGGASQVNGAMYGNSAPPQIAKPSEASDPAMAAPTEYPYRAKAIYSYDANPEDANEISFSKHEILEVSDVSGRWWQARKENGNSGIAPSNYLILL